MPENSSVVNLGELSKPATVLIEKISDAVGGIFKPFQIRRVAEAEAEAEKIHALSKIEITDLNRRAMQRWFQEEAARQQNIEGITRLALPELSENAKPEDIENDWITNFFDKCRLISDETMQQIWAGILAGEAESPGKFSKRTVALLATLDKADAELFTLLCRFCLDFEFDHSRRPIIYNRIAGIYLNAGLDLAALLRLVETGLIHYEEA